jgi:hypothetical protein
MPQLVDHIDAIARQKQRTVLYLEFHPEQIFKVDTEEDYEKDIRSRHYSYQEDKVRDEIIKNLDDMGISWMECGHFASTNFMCSYQGQIYLDVPYDENLDEYKKLQEYLEYSDGSMRFPSVRFYHLPLEIAMQNAHHDVPGFWEDWAENF